MIPALTEQTLVETRPPEGSRSALTGVLRLAVMAISLIVVWCVALPWLALRPQVAGQIKWLDQQGIDPSAMYYTELEAMKPILQKLYNGELAVPRTEQRAELRSAGVP